MQNERDLESTNLDNFNNDLGKMSSETQNKGRYSAGSERLNTSRKKQFAIAGGIGALVLVIIGVSLSTAKTSESSEITPASTPKTLPDISEPSVTEAPVTEPTATTKTSEIVEMEYRHETINLSNSQIKYIIYQGDKQLSYYKFLTGLENEKQLRDYFRMVLNDVPFDTFKWETPSINANTITRPFEFIIVNSPHLKNIRPDTGSFREHFRRNAGKLLSIFNNLGGDSILISPNPPVKNGEFDYNSDRLYRCSSIGPFIKLSSTEEDNAQVDLMLATIGKQGLEAGGKNYKTYISTEGSGVSWLHVRFDPRPKYYSSEYRRT